MFDKICERFCCKNVGVIVESSSRGGQKMSLLNQAVVVAKKCVVENFSQTVE